MILHATGGWKQEGVFILSLDKVGFNPNFIRREKEGHYTLVKGTIHQVEITTANRYELNASAPNFVKQILLFVKGQINTNTSIVVDFNTSLSHKQANWTKKSIMLELSHTTEQTHFKDMYSVLSEKKMHIFLSSMWRFLQNRLWLWSQSMFEYIQKI